MCKVEPGIPYQREQFNARTAYMDASHVYGSTEELKNNLRENNPNNGDLKVSTFVGFEDFGPFPPPNPQPVVPCSQNPNGGPEVPCFWAGDARNVENIALVTIWLNFM